MHRTAVIILATIMSVTTLRAQEAEYMYEIGAGAGTSWAYGDINRSNVIYDPGFAFDLLWRYNLNLRWALAMDLSADALKGDSRDFGNSFPGNAEPAFDVKLWQLAFRPEFTFWNYGLGSDYREKHRLAPFLTMGVGFGLATNVKDTDDTTADNGKRTVAALTVPIGLGLKWKIAPRWNAQLTCLFEKTFSDDLDGISDPYNTGTTVPMNTDWVGTLKLSLTFDFKERCIECHNQNN